MVIYFYFERFIDLPKAEFPKYFGAALRQFLYIVHFNAFYISRFRCFIRCINYIVKFVDITVIREDTCENVDGESSIDHLWKDAKQTSRAHLVEQTLDVSHGRTCTICFY